MMFALLKTTSYLLTPVSGVLFLLTAGLLIARRRRGAGSALVALGILLLYGLSIEPVADALVGPLEGAQPPLLASPPHPDAIVVLGGGARDRSWIGLGSEPTELSLERVVEGVTLYRTLRVPIVVSGGSGDPARTSAPLEAEAMAHTARGLGVPETDIIRESASRNTLESARAVKGLLKGKRIVLVTSALHMKRSCALFTKQGFEVIPAPVGYRSEQRRLNALSFLPHAGCLFASSNALSERLSYLWYAVQGDL